MILAQLMIPAESARDTIEALGDVGLLQFKDLNGDKSSFQRTFANQVKRCDEMARRLRFFKDQVEKEGLSTPGRPQVKYEDCEHFDELENKLETLEKELLEVNSNNERLQRTEAELAELSLVLEHAGRFFDSNSSQLLSRSAMPTDDEPLLEGGAQAAPDTAARVGFVAGTIQQDKLNNFERLLFRATRGNMFLKHVSVGKIRDPTTGEEVSKHVFAVFYAGERSCQKVNKICDAFNANRYPFPEDVTRQRSMAMEVNARVRELKSTNEAGERRRGAMLSEVVSHLDRWITMVRREKAIFNTLNKLSVDVTSKVLIGEAWLPAVAVSRVQETLDHAASKSATQLRAILQPLSTPEVPPTHYETNKFTRSFQNIIDAYGIARYGEVNPAVLTLMSFPFLFAVMFGDIGHAILLCLFAGFLVWKEKELMKQDLGDMVGLLFAGRYVILMMGIYSLYTGVIYNEFFSMPIEMFGPTHFYCNNKTTITQLYYPPKPDYLPANVTWEFDVGGPVDPRDCKKFNGTMQYPFTEMPYVFGMDPIWHGRKTELPYFNSWKMKMSIILGVVHMNFGIIMSVFNHLHFRDYVSLLWEFIPQMVFFNFIFGYLCILIIAKWMQYGCIADLYGVMISLFLNMGNLPNKPLNADGVPPDQVFSGQAGVQKFLLALSLIAVPCMLLPKPFILKSRAQKLAKHKGGHVELSSHVADEDEESSRRPNTHASSGSLAAKDDGHGGDHGDHGHGEHFEFGEVMVHQMIHTIEFVLGAVSNTASYLRLWALSLAHSQLSGVFYDRVLMMAISVSITSKNPIAPFIGFFVFACATLGVLMVMESLSAFLHALRLHWVEYMNKFYKGDGYKFVPFSFEHVLQQNDDDKDK